MVSSFVVTREISGFNATIEYVHNGIIKGDIKARTGITIQGFKSEWVRGQSGIPTGHHYLWNFKEYIQQFNDLDATGSEIGRFYPISSFKDNHRIIRLNDSIRGDIGLHDENARAGSLGCVVVVDNTITRMIYKDLEDTPEGHIPFIVQWIS